MTTTLIDPPVTLKPIAILLQDIHPSATNPTTHHGGWTARNPSRKFLAKRCRNLSCSTIHTPGK